MLYAVKFTEEAARVRDELPGDRRALLERGLTVLAQDPQPKISVPISGDETTRSLALTPNIGIEYLVSDGLLLVLVVHVVDFTQVLVEE
ncbi:hypothetical protein [Streptomyces buecherae]|uniref:Type II toxin-antitoxin system RelE/ParE family toxin n=1 Tax=Streptomyces buecherae TaxID=2763006 RepID=A0A7H8NBK2_9ACTN|nr:hypothetical protein [Streptomyces buecherae]QKW51867.1 hypothetical protein HUT08_22645 [Streptomyces buecherae]